MAKFILTAMVMILKVLQYHAMTKLGQGWSAEDMDAMKLKVSAQFALLVLTQLLVS